MARTSRRCAGSRVYGARSSNDSSSRACGLAYAGPAAATARLGVDLHAQPGRPVGDAERPVALRRIGSCRSSVPRLVHHALEDLAARRSQQPVLAAMVEPLTRSAGSSFPPKAGSIRRRARISSGTRPDSRSFS